MKKLKSLLEASVEIEIPFHDCDPMNVVWHGNYARYFEVARCKLLSAYECGYDNMEKIGYVWPIIDMQTRFVGSCVFGQKINVSAQLLEYEDRLKIAYLITDVETGKKLTTGVTTQVAVEMASKAMQFTTPQPLAKRLREAIAASAM
ncbi:acyl-CoA thioesterase [Pseudoalteromonas luteoviolacea]|uniref:acyl-CoA thioesterase n=1 Tax=Pseudoalteromonas luteoviolacea TaxID=43657 RepID=UPI001F437D32|nr:acyl-CoA thioesterase [Pseudoalteromonas luteoviolacea]MCF6442204.1 acyl-CoA thioesterase [Pseudoalteromonas luteoviolacea]